MVADETGRILTCNEQFARLHGYAAPADMIGRIAGDLVQPEVLARAHAELAPAFAAGAEVVRDVECDILRHDGTSCSVSYNVARVPWPDAPSGVAFIVNVRDITRRKAVIQELEHYRNHLEEQVQARTVALQAEIAERTLTQAALERSRESLFATQHSMVHDITEQEETRRRWLSASGSCRACRL